MNTTRAELSSPIARAALSHYGSLEPVIGAIRAHNPMSLSASHWRAANPGATHAQWQSVVRPYLQQQLHYAPPRCALDAATLSRTRRDGFVLEQVEFNTTPWTRVPGCLLIPDGASSSRPAPGLIVCHAWGGPMVWGRHRVVDLGRDHPLLAEHRQRAYSGRYLAEAFARRGYCVLVIDAHHFGQRIPFGVGDVPAQFDPFDLSCYELVRIQDALTQQLYHGVRQLAWAGTTWSGLVLWDDRRCIDYLQSRAEVDGARIGCTGLSGGAFRTNLLAAMDERIKAAVSVCWMTVGDMQQRYSVQNTIGAFCVLPGVWNELDVPDLIALAAPAACMVISAGGDLHFPPEAQALAGQRLAEAYAWAGVPQRFADLRPQAPHCFDDSMQRQAMAWFDRFLQ